ncbi:alpha/beta hydrolase [Granulosicoccus antarcticus]|uniref:2-succinyl-6-hydroxy-2, 4-cyclohexadiene-1-carboxylate synthase n=1 Tax=Granulosicoccus antarcticus IMCC3135 TaxID=1192854 RepID=A0A2Z2NXV1_9GAMM|nr:alpha/beta fold hydrolase [Granulosicoccus antarcticus]ASJ72577.1 2-succinyl-6-hydroxy-2,4-cyclohexadiene-1-carboxylate synthase [Granulosicoccus antarcticus IMCC3135]
MNVQWNRATSKLVGRLPQRLFTKLLPVLLLLLLSGCTRLFFYPMQQHIMVPATLGYNYQDIFLRASDETRLHAWLIEPIGPPRGTIYFLHGNAENISTHFRATLWLVDKGYEVFALDYRGYGLSQGTPDVPEVFDDIAAGARWITQHVSAAGQAHRPLFLYGQSLGASLAITFAQREATFNEQFNGLITEAAFARYDTIAQDIAARNWFTWGAQYPVRWLIGRHYDPLDAIAQLPGTPKLLIHSSEDTIIPYRFGQALFKAASEPRQMLTTTGPHINAAADPAVRSAMLAFMRRYARPEISPVQLLSDNQTDP